MMHLCKGSLIHAVDGRELRNEEVNDLGPVCDGAIFLAGLADPPLCLVGAGQLLVDLRGRRFRRGQHPNQLRVVQEITLAAILNPRIKPC